MNLKTKAKIKDFLIQNPGYLKKSPIIVYYRIAEEIDPQQYFPVTLPEIIKATQKELRKNNKEWKIERNTESKKILGTIDISPIKPIKRLFIDIEVSPNLVYSWRIGNKINLSIENIVQERAIICVSYKFQGESTVHTLTWRKGDDKELLQKLAKIMNSADELIAHNGDQFDIKWIRARCIYHGIALKEKFNTIDTLKLAKNNFNFNSNKLTYVSQFLGLGKKLDTNYDLWKKVISNDMKALMEMVVYCEQDINLLEKVYNKLQEYSPMKKYKYVKR